MKITKAQLKQIIKEEILQLEAKEFPDLTGDGKVTQADILKGRGVIDEEKVDAESLGEMAKKGDQEARKPLWNLAASVGWPVEDLAQPQSPEAWEILADIVKEKMSPKHF